MTWGGKLAAVAARGAAQRVSQDIEQGRKRKIESGAVKWGGNRRSSASPPPQRSSASIIHIRPKVSASSWGSELPARNRNNGFNVSGSTYPAQRSDGWGTTQMDYGAASPASNRDGRPNVFGNGDYANGSTYSSSNNQQSSQQSYQQSGTEPRRQWSGASGKATQRNYSTQNSSMRDSSLWGGASNQMCGQNQLPQRPSTSYDQSNPYDQPDTYGQTSEQSVTYGQSSYDQPSYGSYGSGEAGAQYGASNYPPSRDSSYPAHESSYRTQEERNYQDSGGGSKSSGSGYGSYQYKDDFPAPREKLSDDTFNGEGSTGRNSELVSGDWRGSERKEEGGARISLSSSPNDFTEKWDESFDQEDEITMGEAADLAKQGNERRAAAGWGANVPISSKKDETSDGKASERRAAAGWGSSLPGGEVPFAKRVRRLSPEKLSNRILGQVAPVGNLSSQWGTSSAPERPAPPRLNYPDIANLDSWERQTLVNRRRTNKDCRLSFITLLAHKNSHHTLTPQTFQKALNSNSDWLARLDELGAQLRNVFWHEHYKCDKNDDNLDIGEVEGLHFVMPSKVDEHREVIRRCSINRISFYRRCIQWLQAQSPPVGSRTHIPGGRKKPHFVLLDRHATELPFALLLMKQKHRANEVDTFRPTYKFNPHYDDDDVHIPQRFRDKYDSDPSTLKLTAVADATVGNCLSVEDSFRETLQTQFESIPKQFLNSKEDSSLPSIKNRLFIVCDLGGKTLRQMARECYTQEAEGQKGTDQGSTDKSSATKNVKFAELQQVVVIAGGPEGYFKDIFDSHDAIRILKERGAPCFISTLCAQDQFTASIQAYFVQSLDMNWPRYKIIHRYLLRQMSEGPEAAGASIQIPKFRGNTDGPTWGSKIPKRVNPSRDKTEGDVDMTEAEQKEEEDLDANLLDDAIASLSQSRSAPRGNEQDDMVDEPIKEDLLEQDPLEENLVQQDHLDEPIDREPSVDELEIASQTGDIQRQDSNNSNNSLVNWDEPGEVPREAPGSFFADQENELPATDPPDDNDCDERLAERQPSERSDGEEETPAPSHVDDEEEQEEEEAPEAD